ncbi:MAG: response regulator transcription factor [Lachnospiraceae bacterium]|nr:response regulator transcription factor [Lachnospiraceae bacterium]
MHYNCLIVDDETDLAKMTAEYFEMFDVSTHYVTSAGECYDFFLQNSADLILLDINLGQGSGFDVCRKIREEYRIPILFISARQSDDDVLVALSIGGDDYIKKPYSLSVLLAKVRVNLKRTEQIKKLEDSVRDASVNNSGQMSQEGSGADESPDRGERLSLDAGTMSAVLDGERVLLKAKEFALLSCLYEHRNTIVTKEKLFDEVWGDSFYSDGTLNVHIRKLREKLEKDPNNPQMIKTIWGTGYILEY